MVEAVDGAFAAAGPRCDLPRGEAAEVAQHDYLALLPRQSGERAAQRIQSLVLRRLSELAGLRQDLNRNDAASTQIVQRDIAGKTQQPGDERHAAVVVLAD